MDKKIDQFTHQKPVVRTLRFSAIPVGLTGENLAKARALENDKELQNKLEQMKGIVKRYNRDYISQKLYGFQLKGLSDYYELFLKKDKTPEDDDAILAMEESFREAISEHLMKDNKFVKMFGKSLVTELLPEYVTTKEEKEVVDAFSKNTTIVTENILSAIEYRYSSEEKVGTFAYRIVHENLPKFISNTLAYQAVKDYLPDDFGKIILKDFGIDNINLDEIFSIDYYQNCITQGGIDLYNTILSGYTHSDGSKVQGLNEKINLAYQALTKEEKRSTRLPKLLKLDKQLLTEVESLSAKNYTALTDYHDAFAMFRKGLKDENGAVDTVRLSKDFLANLSAYDLNGIFVKSDDISTISKNIFNDWRSLDNQAYEAFSAKYDEAHKRKGKNYEENKEKAFKKIRSYSLAEIQEYIRKEAEDRELNAIPSIVNYYVENSVIAYAAVNALIKDCDAVLTKEHGKNYLVSRDENTISVIKNTLDAVKEAERLLCSLKGTQSEEDRDLVFYGDIQPLFDSFREFDRLYNSARNFITKKPSDVKKTALYFGKANAFSGWSYSKMDSYGTAMLRKDGKYYATIINGDKKALSLAKPAPEGEGNYELMIYNAIPSCAKMFTKVFVAKKNLSYFKPSEQVLNIIKSQSFKTNKDDMHMLIDYFKQCCKIHPDWEYDFKFKPTKEYNSMNEFYKDADKCAYSVEFRKVSAREIDKMISNGTLYLFQLYNKDMSEYSHGTKNLHTLYFEQLFDPENLKTGNIRLNGGAQIFYRPATRTLQDKDIAIHPANESINNKNPLNKNEKSTFTYDIVKDRRLTKDAYQFNMCITLNANDMEYGSVNLHARQLLKEDKNPVVIGVTRGERNLVYVVAMDYAGNVLEQRSLNIIESTYKNGKVKTDYKQVLNKKEHERTTAKKNWNQVENIKEAKAGFCSFAVNEIAKMVEKYDAVVAIEDLSGDFKQSRRKIDSNIYSNFENALQDKLSYLVNKKIPANEPGGVANGRQLCLCAADAADYKSYQNGFTFFVSPAHTTNLDPTTGFYKNLSPYYKNMAKAKEWFDKFDTIRYNSEDDLFEFSYNVDNFSSKYNSEDFNKNYPDFKKDWTICTNGTRSKFERDEKSGAWKLTYLNLTKTMKSLLDEQGINYQNGEDIKSAILEVGSAAFFKGLTDVVYYTLQMCNKDDDEKEDYFVSPVKNANGQFFDTRYIKATDNLPICLDANGAYNLTRKTFYSIERMKEAEDLKTAKIFLKANTWLDYAQKNPVGTTFGNAEKSIGDEKDEQEERD